MANKPQNLSEKQQLIERRKFPRFTATNEFFLMLNGIKHQGEIGIISLGGVYLSTISPAITEKNLFQDGEIKMNLVGIDITIPCSITFAGSEHSKNVHGVGIAFSTVDEQSLAIISDYIEHIQPPIEEMFKSESQTPLQDATQAVDSIIEKKRSA